MRRLLVTLLGWLVLTLGLLVLLQQGDEELEARLAPSRRLTYGLSPDQPVSFAIEPETIGVKIFSWVVRGTDWNLDPRIISPYCIGAVLRDREGNELARWKTWMRGRQSIGRTEGFPTQPSTWLPDNEAAVTDGRVTRLELPPVRPLGVVLEVHNCGQPADSELRFVAFGSDERPPAAQARMQRSLEAPEIRAAYQRFTTREWLELAPDWRSELVAIRWQRLGALESEHPVEPKVLLSTFGQGESRGAGSRGVPVPPGGALAFNLEGDTALSLSWWTMDGAPALRQETDLRIVSAEGEVEKRRLGPEALVFPLAAGQGVRSVQVGLPADAVAPLVLRAHTLYGSVDRALGDPPRGEVDPATGRQEVGPDLRGLELYRALSVDKHAPLRFPVGGEENLWVRFLAPLPPGLPGLFGDLRPRAPGPVLTLKAKDVDGKVLGTWSKQVELRPSLFERYAQLLTPGLAGVSEAGELLFSTPEDTVVLEAMSDGAVDTVVRLRSSMERSAAVPGPGFELPEDAVAVGLYAPSIHSRWRNLTPEDQEGLLLQGRISQVDFQVRLELPTGEGDEQGGAGVAAGERDRARHSLSLGLGGRIDTATAPLEQVTEPDQDGVPGPTSRVRLGSSRATVVVGPSGRLLLEHVFSASRLGQELVLEVGGRSYSVRPRATTGVETLHGVPPGSHKVRLVSVGGEALRLGGDELVLARSDGGGPLWANREVRRLAPGTELSHGPLPAGPNEVGVFVYGATDLARLEWRIDGVALGPEAEAEAQLAGAKLLVPGTVSGFLLSQGAQRLRRARRVDISLPEGLPAGGRLTLEVTGATSPVFIRALSSWRPPRAEQLRHWAIDAAPVDSP